jgi:hypothetical protein
MRTLRKKTYIRGGAGKKPLIKILNELLGLEFPNEIRIAGTPEAEAAYNSGITEYNAGLDERKNIAKKQLQRDEARKLENEKWEKERPSRELRAKTLLSEKSNSELTEKMTRLRMDKYKFQFDGEDASESEKTAITNVITRLNDILRMDEFKIYSGNANPNVVQIVTTTEDQSSTVQKTTREEIEVV